MEADHRGVEIKVDATTCFQWQRRSMLTGLTLQCQCAYDSGPGQDLVSMYHLIKLSDNADRPEEVRVKVFLPWEDPRVPSVYWIWKTADWQERVLRYDWHCLRRTPESEGILMPEDCGLAFT